MAAIPTLFTILIILSITYSSTALPRDILQLDAFRGLDLTFPDLDIIFGNDNSNEASTFFGFPKPSPFEAYFEGEPSPDAASEKQTSSDDGNAHVQNSYLSDLEPSLFVDLSQSLKDAPDDFATHKTPQALSGHSINTDGSGHNNPPTRNDISKTYQSDDRFTKPENEQTFTTHLPTASARPTSANPTSSGNLDLNSHEHSRPIQGLPIGSHITPDTVHTREHEVKDAQLLNHETPPKSPGVYLEPRHGVRLFPETELPQDSLPDKECSSHFIFDFDDRTPLQEKRNQLWMGREGRVKVQNNAAVFNGFGYLYIPYFSGNDLRPSYRISLRIFPQPVRSQGQAIFSNSLSPYYSSLSLVLTEQEVHLVVDQRIDKDELYINDNNQEPVVLSLPVQTGAYSVISVEQDDVTISMRVGNLVAQAQGRLPRVTEEPLYIGSGTSAFGSLSQFTGFIDRISFSKCPRKIA